MSSLTAPSTAERPCFKLERALPSTAVVPLSTLEQLARQQCALQRAAACSSGHARSHFQRPTCQRRRYAPSRRSQHASYDARLPSQSKLAGPAAGGGAPGPSLRGASRASCVSSLARAAPTPGAPQDTFAAGDEPARLRLQAASGWGMRCAALSACA